MRGYTDVFDKNVTSTKDNTYKNFENLINNKNIVILKGDKELSIVILDKIDYIVKLKDVIQDDLDKDLSELTQQDTLQHLKRFQYFLRRNFKDYEHYNKMHSKSNQPARINGTPKTHEFNNIDKININDLKFRPIIDQTNTYAAYQTAKVISDYLKP